MKPAYISSKTVALVLSESPFPAEQGRLWRAVRGEPAYCRVLYPEDGSTFRLPAPDAKVTVWIGKQIDTLTQAGDPAEAGALLAVGQEPEPGFEEPFNAWMDEEHVPSLGAVPGTMSAHRYQSDDSVPRYYAVYYLRDTDILETSDWKLASASPRGDEMRPHARHRVMGLYVPEE